jgi:hypothetical protein
MASSGLRRDASQWHAAGQLEGSMPKALFYRRPPAMPDRSSRVFPDGWPGWLVGERECAAGSVDSPAGVVIE